MSVISSSHHRAYAIVGGAMDSANAAMVVSKSVSNGGGDATARMGGGCESRLRASACNAPQSTLRISTPRVNTSLALCRNGVAY
jgi:hypothetical protein